MILMASTMGIFIILSIFAFYLARFSITETRSGAYYVQDIKARNLALSGAEHGMQILVRAAKRQRMEDVLTSANASENDVAWLKEQLLSLDKEELAMFDEEKFKIVKTFIENSNLVDSNKLIS